MSILTGLEGLVKGALAKIKGLLKNIDPKLQLALTLSTNLRAFLQSPTGSFIVALIPATWAEDAKAEVLTILNQEIPALQIEQTCGVDPECWAQSIAKLPKDIQDAIVFKFASKVLAWYDGAKQPIHIYDTIVQNAVAGKK